MARTSYGDDRHMHLHKNMKDQIRHNRLPTLKYTDIIEHHLIMLTSKGSFWSTPLDKYIGRNLPTSSLLYPNVI